MKLLILTQKIDKEDPILGFFHNWVLELSKKFEKITIVCLEKGESDLSPNVRVFSLGKSAQGGSALGGESASKIKYVKNFYNLILGLHKEYDSVFIHMNQEYVILGWFVWKVMRKKIFFWRNHPRGNLLTRIAVGLSNKVFCTSPYSFTAKFKKTRIMPVGVDTSKFKAQSEKFGTEGRGNKILFLGRISPIKRPDLLVEALDVLNKKNTNFVCNLYGDPVFGDEDYHESLKLKTKELKLETKINLHKGVPNYETPKIYNEHKVYVNLTTSGSFDKTILEAAACGCILVVTNKSLLGEIDPNMIIEKDNPEEISKRIEFWLNADHKKTEQASLKLQQYVLENHSLGMLVDKLSKEIQFF